MAELLERLAATLIPTGLILRGGFHPEAGEAGLAGVGTVLLIGNAGPGMWDAFAPSANEATNPLDSWTRRVVDPIAEALDARAVYPFGPAPPPFQRWALRAEPVHASPLGILIHPRYGLWHAYRAAVLLAERLTLPPQQAAPSPCHACAGKPCLSACPVGAFTAGRYDVPSCAGYIGNPEADCLDAGCRARNACPVGPEWRYGAAQTAFHMRAFGRALGVARAPGGRS